MNPVLHVTGYVLIALFFPALLWLLVTGGTRRGVRTVFTAWSTRWRTFPVVWRVALPLGLLSLWGVGIVLSATWGQSGPGADWALGLRQGVIQLPLWASVLLLGPELSKKLNRR